MTAVEVLTAIRRAWWVALICALVGAGAMLGLSSRTTPTYAASARVFVSIAKGKSATDLSQGATFVQSQVASYADLVTSPFVLEPVAKKLGVDGGGKKLADVVTGSATKETVLITIKATDTDPQRASDIADAVADELGAAVRQLAPRDTDARPMVQVVTVARSGPPSAPVSPQTSQNTMVGALAGGIIGLVLAVWIGRPRERSAHRWFSKKAEQPTKKPKETATEVTTKQSTTKQSTSSQNAGTAGRTTYDGGRATSDTGGREHDQGERHGTTHTPNGPGVGPRGRFPGRGGHLGTARPPRRGPEQPDGPAQP
ncbi:hypothetical protein KEM60_00317 [Austwickia sp. TVS 96-490-7B]|uniref:YveK family protein n=1 Tax=Austwickia sp. TVS 96-490-7B TaxID=2830843 RepID=UPI001E196D3F|nr:Wzz/FepE/Etk N-terminal domain-containing protein [Austwickia sp. TVS 96-490-7B]MBW3084133.1 hypothetical protein [Austwickia sp. TVS 96-490-7B]